MRLDLPRTILTFCLFLSFVRGTNIGLFYPSDEFELGSIDYIFQTLSNFVLLLGLTFYFFVKNDYSFFRRKFSNPWWALPAALGFCSLAFSVDKVESVKFIVALGVITLPSLLYMEAYGADKFLKALGLFAALMAFVNLAYVLIFPEYGIMSARHDGRWRGMFEHKNISGPFFAIGFYLALRQLASGHVFRRLFYAASLPICFAFILFAQSSTAWVAFFILGFGLLGFECLYRLHKPGERIAVFLLAIFSALCIFTFAGGLIMDEFFALTGKDATLTGRTGIWLVILDLVSHRPLLGYGPGMSERPDFMAQIQGDVGWNAKGTHNSFLDMLIGFGYPMTILFSFLIFKIWLTALSGRVVLKSQLRLYVMASGLILAVLAIALSSSGMILSRSVFWIMLAASLSILSVQSQSNSKQGTV